MHSCPLGGLLEGEPARQRLIGGRAEPQTPVAALATCAHGAVAMDSKRAVLSRLQLSTYTMLHMYVKSTVWLTMTKVLSGLQLGKHTCQKYCQSYNV